MAHSKLYVQLMNSREWRELREAKIRANPLCECCQAKGYVVSARCVHHIVEVESGRTEQECRDLCFQWTNLQALWSHSKEAHQQRASDRLAQWIKQHEPGRSESKKNSDTPGA